MGANRVVVPGVLILTSVLFVVLAFATSPPGTVRTALLAAGGVDFLLGLALLVFGVPGKN